MEVSNVNNVKIYKLSGGKAQSETLSDGIREKAKNKDDAFRKRVELIQDFEMPGVSYCVKMSPDGQYICASGTYKPKFRCYDVHQLCLKFDRGLDSDIVNFELMAEDYSKVCFLNCDRYVEFHNQSGRLLRLRIPKFGRDLAYYPPSCEVYFAAHSSEIYRLNLEKGRFMKPLQTSGTDFNCCEFNPVNHLFGAGSVLGHLECWDPRDKTRCGILDVAASNFIQDLGMNTIPEITAMKFRNDGLTVGLGTSTGHVLLYDLRARKPFYVKDHNYELPIKSIEFQDSQDLVMSMDSKILKMWNRNTGKHLTSIEPGVSLNQLCVVPDSGLLFIANEAPKILSYFIPTLGPAPRWCITLDSITEELEEKTESSLYDDYKFITRSELEELGLTHLIGTNLLKAVMHGYFVDIRLYHKAKSIADPFAFDKYRKAKIREKIEAERQNRVKLKKLPPVNRELAAKLLEEDDVSKVDPSSSENRAVKTILKDDRFAAMFQNPDFQVDTESSDYKLLNPLVSKLDKDRKKRQEKSILSARFKEVEGEDEVEGRPSDESSSDDEQTWTRELKQQHQQAVRLKEREDRAADLEEKRRARLFEIKDGEQIGVRSDQSKRRDEKLSLAERLEASKNRDHSTHIGSVGNREMTFTSKKKKDKRSAELERRKEHMEERQKIRRSGNRFLKPAHKKMGKGGQLM